MLYPPMEVTMELRLPPHAAASRSDEAVRRCLMLGRRRMDGGADDKLLIPSDLGLVVGVPIERDIGQSRAPSCGEFPQVLELRLVLVVEGRSEEHTAELQSLMRISYAVFSFN